MSITPEGLNALEDSAAEHLAAVGLGAIARARRENLATVDVTHVERADEASGGTTRGTTLIGIFNSLGGVVAGVGLALLITLVNRPDAAGPPTTADILFAVISTLIGGLMLAIAATLQVVNAVRH